MSREEVDDRLSKISTDWGVLKQAHAGADSDARAAQELLIVRYGAAIRRYLGKVAGDPEAAEELFQEFGVAVVEGKLGSAAPDRGRFRDYVKAVLRHLVAKYHAKRRKRPQALGDDGPALREIAARDEDDSALDTAWRDALMARAWAALRDAHKMGYDVLRYRAENPALSSTDLATRLTAKLGRALSPEAVRQTIHRARKQFAMLLIDEVSHSLTSPTTDAVGEELAELGLLEYCRPALEG